MTYQAKVIAGGKIVIPAELRREFGISEGDSLVIERQSSGGFVVKTFAQVVAEVQEEFRLLVKPGDRSIVDELIAEREAEAAREEADHAAWLARQTSR